MTQRSTLDPVLCRTADAAEENARLLSLADLLTRLWHHHVSQAKSAVPPCSKSYNKELADEISWHLGWRQMPAPKAGVDTPRVRRTSS